MAFQALTEIQNIKDIVKEVLNILLSPSLQAQLLPLKIFFLIFFIFFFGSFLFLLFNTSLISWQFYFIKNFFFPHFTANKKVLQKQWDKIKNLAGSSDQGKRKIALLRASGILNVLLQNRGFFGKNLSEKLSFLPENLVSSLNDIRQAEKICQDIINEPDLKLDKKTVDYAMEIFEKVMEELEFF